MNVWQIVAALCGAASVLAGGLNAWQNTRIELRIANLRNELLEGKIQPLSERVAKLEAQLGYLSEKGLVPQAA